MTAEARYTIAELVERTGIPATTIHHYRNAGLLPPPERVGANRFRYSDRHVQALRLIRVLRDRRRLPLPAIREVLPELLASGDEEAFHTETWEAALTGRPGVPDATRGRIVDAAVELFAARGYGDVAVSDVAAKAGTAKGSVYRHFESKEALFGAAVDSVVAGVVDDLRAAADKAGGQLDPPAAMVALVMSARPGFMLLLELTGGSLRGQPGHRELADRALTCFVDGVGPLLTGPGTARERAIALIVELARQTMRAVLGGG
ncbi:MAG TPA: MerR family transcriptional regulator [Acidimicrobiales bacterium]|jgi:AcrR family transcriptional regulator/predicted DNA-binding transcriptional regulator AlpA|nr:MerR family transcriptional regulator [Acidimicrobiales bacterium]